jgi:putative phosphoesterase
MILPSARTVRVGLIADSHVGEYLERMPDWVFDTLAGCALILHAGDLSVPGALTDLEMLAPVRAVRGDHDRDLDHLPEAEVVTVDGWRIGLVHGSWGRVWDATAVAGATLTRRTRWQPHLELELAGRLGAVDALVYGHWHIPRIAHHGALLAICPGAVCPGGALGEGAPIPRTVHAPIDVAVRRFRRTSNPDAVRPAVAVLETGSSGLRAWHCFDPASGPTTGHPRP